MNAPGFWEIVFLAFLALVIFGPKRLPELARSLGVAIAKLKQETSSTMQELKAAAELEEYQGLSDELKATTADLKRSTALAGPIASSSKPKGEPTPTVRARGRPPFDPDAT